MVNVDYKRAAFIVLIKHLAHQDGSFGCSFGNEMNRGAATKHQEEDKHFLSHRM